MYHIELKWIEFKLFYFTTFNLKHCDKQKLTQQSNRPSQGNGLPFQKLSLSQFLFCRHLGFELKLPEWLVWCPKIMIIISERIGPYVFVKTDRILMTKQICIVIFGNPLKKRFKFITDHKFFGMAAMPLPLWLGDSMHDHSLGFYRNEPL